MNPLNYASLEASKKLAEAGIVIETEKYWYHNTFYDSYELVDEIKHYLSKKDYCPAPSMAEVWRELPESVVVSTMTCALLCSTTLMIWRFHDLTEVGYWWHEEVIASKSNINSTDALIDLLIWVRKEAK